MSLPERHYDLALQVMAQAERRGPGDRSRRACRDCCHRLSGWSQAAPAVRRA
jgi:hypothetical protein